MKKFTIKSTEQSREYSDYIKIYAVDENNNQIFGAEVELRNDKYEKKGWTISWAGCGSKTYQEKLPEFKVIEAGMERLKELNVNKDNK